MWRRGRRAFQFGLHSERRIKAGPRTDEGLPSQPAHTDMYAVSYTTGNFTATHDMNPCTDFEGLKAKVTYGAVDDPTVAGQIVAMELNH